VRFEPDFELVLKYQLKREREREREARKVTAKKREKRDAIFNGGGEVIDGLGI